jgi:hypothetical protein
MAKNVLIFALTVMLVWFGSAVIRLERYHYASMLGMCGPLDPLTLAKRDVCLTKAETRTSSVYHLLYGLGVL